MSLLRSLHAWVGAAFALVFILMGLTGVASVLRGEVIQLTVPAAQAPAPVVATFGPALEAFEASGDDRIRSATFAPYELGVHRLRLSDGANAFIDPKGGLVQRWRGNERLEELVLSAHKSFLIKKNGNFAVGSVALVGLGLALTGLVIWAASRPRLSLRIWPKGTDRPAMLSAHRALGSILALFLIVQVTSAILLAFGVFTRPLLGFESATAPKVTATFQGAPSWTRLLAAAQTEFPQAEIRRVSAPPQPDRAAAVYLRRPGELDPEGDTVVFLDSGAVVVGQRRGADQGVGARVYDSLKAIHSGDYGGAPTRILVGAVGLSLTALGVFGLWSFLRGPRVRRRSGRA